MDDLTQRDLSHKRDAELTAEERLELRRRFDDFLAMMRRSSGGPELVAPPAKTVKRWRPTGAAKRP